MAFDEKLAQRVRSVLSDRTDVQEQKMMGKLAFMVDGSMCCSVGVEGILIRVDPRERSKLLARPHVTEMKLGKRIMKGFVRIGPEACRTKRALTRWIERGIASGAV